MTQQKPLIDTARVNFSGISEESFEDLGELNVGDIRYFTIRARVKGYSAVDMAEAGVRRLANLKVLKVVEGVSEKVKDDGDDNQPSLFTPPADGGDDDQKGTDDAPDPTPDDTPSNVTKGAFAGGPKFSAGDEA